MSSDLDVCETCGASDHDECCPECGGLPGEGGDHGCPCGYCDCHDCISDDF